MVLGVGQHIKRNTQYDKKIKGFTLFFWIKRRLHY